MRHPRRQIVIVGLSLLILGCSGPRNFHNTNDDLRAQRVELQRDINELETQLENRLGQIRALRQQLAAQGTDPDLDPPVFSSVSMGRYTAPVDLDGDGRDDVIRLYIQTLDQQGRMLPLAGRATVTAVIIEEGQPPALYSERTYDPQHLDAAYRSEFTGTHYTLELELDKDFPAELTVKVTVTTQNISHDTQQTFRIAPGR